jgi:hypothetical protein
MSPVEIEFKDAERILTRTVIREVEPGVYRWLSISATSVLNKDGEIDSQELFDNFVRHIEETGEYPVRRFHHINHPNFITGQTDFVARDEHALITSGLFNDSDLAQREIASRIAEPELWGESIGYLPTSEPEMIDVSGVDIPVYVDGVFREVSTVKQENACSWFTTTAMLEEVQRMSLHQRAREALAELYQDEDELKAFLEGVDVTNREIDEEQLISREDSEDEEPETEVVEEREVEEAETTEAAEEEVEAAETEREAPELVLDDEAIAAIAEKFSGVVEPIRERITQLESLIHGLNDDQEAIVNDAAAAVAKLNKRLTALERDEEEKREEWQADLPARVHQVRVTHRPREANAEEDTEVPSMASMAEETLGALQGRL